MRKLFLSLAFISLPLISGCGGGGGGGETPPPAQPTTATLKLSVSGTLSSGTFIGGVDVTIRLAPGVTVESTPPPATDTGVVVASGVASNSSIIGAYTPASGGSSASVRVLLANSNGFGTGEFATINCDIASGSSPEESEFTIEALEVKDLNGAAIGGMTAGLVVMLQ